MLQVGNIYANLALSAESDEARRAAQDKAIEAYDLALSTLAEESGRVSDAQRLEYGRAATFNMAQILAFEERFEEAAQAFAAFLELEPDNVAAQSNAAVVNVRAATQTREAAEQLEDGPEKEALLAKADSMVAVANAFYAELLAREDLKANEYHNVGLGLTQIGFDEDAVIAYEKALDLEPYRVTSLEQLARAHFGAQEWEKLAAVAKLLVERYPLNLDNLALLANAYRELELNDSALVVLQQREALDAELLELVPQPEEGAYTVTGYLHNLKSEPGTELTLQFDFYDSEGAIVASEMLSLRTPEKEARAEFSVSTESSHAISGFTYRRADPGAGG